MTLALSTLILVVGLGGSQGSVRGFRWWLDPQVQHELALTDSQVAQIAREFSRTLEHRRLLRQKFDVADAELARAFARGDLSDEAAEALVTRVEDLRRQRNVARLHLLVALYFLLTPEQRVRLRQVVDKASIGIATSC
jgi:Spy/CpxP family protein refolding chaperone